MRTTPLLLLSLLAGCWPYIPVSAVPVSTPGVTGDDDDDNGSAWDSPCADGPAKTGPWNSHPIGLAGVDVRKSPYSFDAGVGAVLDEALNADSPTSVNLEINDAIVVATDDDAPSGKLTAMIADGAGTMVLYAVAVDFSASSVFPGDRIDLRVFEVVNYGGIPEITDANVAIGGSGEDVYVRQFMDGEALKFARQPLEMVEMWGEIVSGSEACGDMDCFDLDYGVSDPVRFRAPAGELRKGDCVHYIAPVGQFEGVTEMSMENPAWYRTF